MFSITYFAKKINRCPNHLSKKRYSKRIVIKRLSKQVSQNGYSKHIQNLNSMIFRTITTDADKLSKQLGILGKSFYDIKKDFKNGLGVKNSLFSTKISSSDLNALKSFNSAIKNTNDGLTKSQRITKAWNENMTGCSIVVLCQDLVQVKMSFSHSNLPVIPKFPVDTTFQNHRVTCNRNDYEFVWYYKTFPSIQIPGGMHVCNC